MSRVDDLIARSCAKGVRHLALGEVGTLYGGLTGKSKRDFGDSGARYVSYVDVYSSLALTRPPDHRVRVSEGERQNRIQRGDVLFTASSERPDECGMSAAVTFAPQEPIYLNSFCFGFRPTDPTVLDPEFAKHLFRSTAVRRQIGRTANGVTRFNVSKKRFIQVVVPVPPVEVQGEVVRLLDMLASLNDGLTGDLQAEIRARKSQYAFHLNALFDLPRSVPRREMGDLGVFTRGRRFTKNDVVADGLSSIHYGEIYTRYGTSADRAVSRVRPELAPNLRFAQHGDVVIAAVGETVEDVAKAVAWLGDEQVAIHDDCFAYRHPLNPKYVSYYFQTVAFHAEKGKHVARAKVKRISGTSLAKLTIPVPPTEEQERIVATLDKFEALTTDLLTGLPVELAARRKQYEHYRDRLLTFTELPAEQADEPEAELVA